eukprot:Phypoly_transcript_08278.p1 GENE.Phypoly_transcript_08278~~Phypoly_transcript_08278.p1  ORF type:complete len:441 (+),score=47.31 Phypoly_transcript_08278:149-1471(+)
MEEIHYVGTTFPTNIYGSCVFHCFGRTSVVVGSRQQVLLISPVTTPVGVLQWLNDELSLPYFNAEEGDTIVSIDAFVHAETGLPVIGVCGVRGSQKGAKGFFGIHTGTKSASKELFYEFESSVMDLNFAPLVLTHTEVLSAATAKRVFILSGNDEQLHLYTEDRKPKEFQEIPLKTHFPEIVNVASSALTIDIQYTGKLRVVALGYQSGFVALSVFDESTEAVVSTAHVMQDGPVSTLKMYSPDIYSNFTTYQNRNKPVHIHPSLEDFDKYSRAKNQTNGEVPVHLVVGSALGYAIVFKNILTNGLESRELLPYSQSNDAVTSVNVLDWDMDCVKEVCVGSYGRTVSMFKEKNNVFSLVGRFNFPQPVESTLPCHFTHDGLMGLAVFCFSGVHFIRPKFSVAKAKIEEGMRLIQEKRNLERLLKEETEKINSLKAQLGQT